MKRRRDSALPMTWLVPSLAIAMGLMVPGVRAGEDDGKKPGRIALFGWLDRGGKADEAGVYVVDPSTDAFTKVVDVPLGNGPISLDDLRLSPDGLRIAYGRLESVDGLHSRHASIWLQDLKADAPARKISDLPGWPIWSPDGKRLLVLEFLGHDKPEKRSRYRASTINLDGSDPVRLPVPDDFQVEDWSRDGRWLTGIKSTPNNPRQFEIVIMHPDGTGQRSLTRRGGGFNPRFSPDGRQVVYEVPADPERESLKRRAIAVSDLVGIEVRKIFEEPDGQHIGAFAWSPDGQQLAVTIETWGGPGQGLINPRLCLVDVADGRTRTLSHPRATVLGRPQWR